VQIFLGALGAKHERFTRRSPLIPIRENAHKMNLFRDARSEILFDAQSPPIPIRSSAKLADKAKF